MRFEPISQDPDLAQAIDDFAPRALAVRELSARALKEALGSPYRLQDEATIREHMSVIELRARRMGLTGAALFEVINAAIDAKARRGRPVPARDTSRTLITNVSNAHARLETAREARRVAEVEVNAAEQHLAACEEAAVAWGAKRRDQ